MRMNKKIKLGLFFLIGILLILIMASFVSAVYMRSGIQYTQYGQYAGAGAFPGFPREQCEAGQDFIIQIAPFGCTPAVVRSDLLEEQNVPVLCQLSATNMNPLIDVETINYISIVGEYPKEVATVGFHPARSALGTRAKISSPIMNNIGYAVIVLRRQANESALSNCEKTALGEFCSVEGNLTARIRYDVKNAFGIGRATFYLPELDDFEWEQKHRQYSFWNGRGYLRAESIDESGATISVYSGQYQRTLMGQTAQKQRYSEFNLRKGESARSYLPGFDYCLASFNVTLNDLENPDTRAQLRINADIVEVGEGEEFLENRCRVIKIYKEGINKKVKIDCKGDREAAFNLIIAPKIKLNINKEEQEVSVGDWLYKKEDGTKSVYLGYAGTKGDTEQLEDLYVYFVAIPEHKDRLSEGELSLAATMARAYEAKKDKAENIFQELRAEAKFIIGGLTDFYKWLVDGESFEGLPYMIEGKEVLSKEIFGKDMKIVNFASAKDRELSEARDSFDKAMEDYKEIVESFSGEANPEQDTETLGERALYEMIILAGKTGQKKTMLDLCEEFKQSYPDSKKSLDECTNPYKLSNTEISVKDITLDGRIERISFEDIYDPSYEEYSARIQVRFPNTETRYFDLRKDQTIYLDDSQNDYIQLVDLEKDYAIVNMNVKSKTRIGEYFTSLRERLALDSTESFGSGYSFTLTDVNLKKVAKVSIIPNIDYARTEADFNFKINIEKRSSLMKLSPDKTQEKIEKLEGDIEKWESISEHLGTVVKAMNTACLLTSGGLTVKNFLENTKGKGIARRTVMRGEGGWYKLCAAWVKDKVKRNGIVYKTQEECLIKESDNIENNVDYIYRVLSKQNHDLKILQNQFPDEGEFMEEYSGQVKTLVEKDLEDEFANPDKAEEFIHMNEITDALDTGKGYDVEQLRDIELYTELSKSDDSAISEMANKKLYSVLFDIKVNTESLRELEDISTRYGVKEVFMGSSEKLKHEFYISNPDAFGDLRDKNKFKGALVEEIDKSLYTIVYKDQYDGKKYLLVLDGDYVVNQTYLIGPDNILTIKDEKDINPLRIGFQKYDSSSYENTYTNPEVKYYETPGPYKGYPAIVAFDKTNGWYVVTRSVLPFGENIKSFDKSGRVTNFYLCNVGRNGLEENIGGDDICEMINLDKRQPYNQFPGLSEIQAYNLVVKAVNAVEAAQRQYKTGVSWVTINYQRIKVGKPAAEVPEIQCQDFMSPKDCNLLFNVCDPVVCPESRCNFGGNYYVRDVVQSGIIGSIALCLPNYKEKIYVPVCLTGIHAGIDGLLSVKKSYRDCLQSSLDTGETIGICDEIHSIYMCDFFWRQGMPLLKAGIPKLIGLLSGQQTARGGGEYLGFADAWAGAEKSVSYFTQYYAREAYKAFKIRSTKDVGIDVCKVFASVRYPDQGNLLNSITTPASPPQFHGRFDEIPFTTVTNPPMSQYKVFYFIFAGKDTGAYYSVYLKGDAGSSFYQDTAVRYMVATGYIPRGDYKSETRDFLAASGYAELCIMVNGQEECGFKQVSTSFAVNYVKDQYLKEQAAEVDVKTEQECISGSASLYSLLNPNIQEGIGDVMNPELYNRGIVRICATDNPGKGTDPSAGIEGSRWVEVGYCGDRRIKCWLDQESVKKVIEFTDVEEDVLNVTSNSYLDVLRNEAGYLDEKEFDDMIAQINEEESDNKKISLVNSIFEKVFLNSERAYLMLLRGNAYANLAVLAYERLTKGEVEMFSEYFGFFVFEQKNIYYKYSGGEWYWTKNYGEIGETYVRDPSYMKIDKPAMEEISWINVTSVKNPYGINPSKKNKEFIESLQNKNFDGGFNLLVSRTIEERFELVAENSNVLKESVITLSPEKVIKVDFEDEGATDFYYKHSEFRWYSLEGSAQKDLPSGHFLEGKSLFAGAKILFLWLSEEEAETVESLYELGGEQEETPTSEEPADEETEPPSETERTIWTLDSAIEHVKTLKGKYSDNKEFVDQLYEDLPNILEEEEYNKIRGKGTFWSFLVPEKDMAYLKTLLLEKKLEQEATPGQGTPGGLSGPVEPLAEVEDINDPESKVLREASTLKGRIAEENSDCFKAIKFVYDKAGVGLSHCMYSDTKGREYDIGEDTITIGVDKNPYGDIFFQMATNPKDCVLNSGNENFLEDDKLSGLQAGYLISYVYNPKTKSPHNAIFIGWVPETGEAKLFDWNGDRLTLGERDSEGKECTSKDFYPGESYCKTFHYYDEYLTDDKHPVYMYWKPELA